MTNTSSNPPSAPSGDRLSSRALGLAAVIFAGIGLEALFAPDLLLGPVELPIPSISAYAELRAAYAGTFGALAVLFFQGARKPHLRGTALMVITVLLGVFSGARVFSWFVDGTPNAFSHLMHGLETAGFVLSAWLWRRQSRREA